MTSFVFLYRLQSQFPFPIIVAQPVRGILIALISLMSMEVVDSKVVKSLPMMLTSHQVISLILKEIV